MQESAGGGREGGGIGVGGDGWEGGARYSCKGVSRWLSLRSLLLLWSMLVVLLLIVVTVVLLLLLLRTGEELAL